MTFKLRADLEFSDGTRLTAKDAAWSIRRVLLPATGAPVAEEFLSAADVTVETPDERTVLVHLPRRVIGIGKVFDEIAIEPADRPSEGRVTAGPFVVADYRVRSMCACAATRITSGPDSKACGLPYATGIRLDILDNHEQEIRLFERGEYDLIDSLPPDYFEPAEAEGSQYGARSWPLTQYRADVVQPGARCAFACVGESMVSKPGVPCCRFAGHSSRRPGADCV